MAEDDAQAAGQPMDEEAAAKAAAAAAKADEDAQQEKAAIAIQAAMRSRATRRTSNGERAAARAAKRREMQEEEAARIAAEEEAARLAERQRIAEDKYAEADVDGDESVSKEELGALIASMLADQGLELQQEVIDDFVVRQFEAADQDDDGTVSFEEFCAYYNELVDTLSGDQRGGIIKGLQEKEEELSAERAKAEEERQLKSDIKDMEMLMRFIGIITHPSVAPVSGTQLLFERSGEPPIKPEQMPQEEEVRTTQGIVVDVNKFGQRLITPWGAYPISYTLTFEGYNDGEGVQRAAEEDAALDRLNTESFYFVLCRINSPLLHFKKLPERTHFLVTNCLGAKGQEGVVVGEMGYTLDDAVVEKMRARFAAALEAAAVPEIPSPAPYQPGEFLINQLLHRTVAVNERLLQPLEERLKKSKTRPKQEVLRTALLLAGNAVDEAVHLRQEHLKSVDKLVSARKGYSTRDHCDDVLTMCRWDYEAALFVLDNEAQFDAVVSEIMKRRGLASGVGFPVLPEVQWEVAQARNDKAVALRAIMRQWNIEVRMMREIVQHNPVDEILRDEAELCWPGREHIEELLQKHSFDVDYVKHLLSDTAFIMQEKAELGNPTRERVEELVEHFDFDEYKVRTFLQSTEYIFKNRRQVGNPTRKEIEHYLAKHGYDQKRAVAYMKRIWRFLDPAPPKDRAIVPKKVEGRLVKHIAHVCELLVKGAVAPWARASVEFALDSTQGESGEDNEDEAIAFLIKVSKMSKEVPHLPRWELEYAVARSYQVDNDDGKVTIEETMAQWKKFDQYYKTVKGLGDPDRRRVGSLMQAMGHDEERVRARLAHTAELQRLSDEHDFGLSVEQIEALLDRHDQSVERCRAYLVGMHTLRERAHDFGDPTRKALEAALRKHNLDVTMAIKDLSAAHMLLTDREFLAEAGQPNAEDVDRALSLVDFEYDRAKAMLLHVSELKVQSERWGSPSREHIEDVLQRCELDKARALAAIKEEYRAQQIADFKVAQKERKHKERAEAEAQRIILADDPKEFRRIELENKMIADAELDDARLSAEIAMAQASQDAAEAEAKRKADEEERRKMRMAALNSSGPSKQKSSERVVKPKDDRSKSIDEQNAERLARIAALSAGTT